MQTGTREQIPKRRTNPLQSLALGQLARRRAGYQHHVLAVAQLALDPVERFAQETLDEVTLDRASDLAGDRQPQTWALRRGVWEAVQHQVTISRRASVAVDPLKLRAPGEATSVGSATRRSRCHLVTPTGACGPCPGGA